MSGESGRFWTARTLLNMATAIEPAQTPTPPTFTASPTSEKLKEELGRIVAPSRILTRPIDLIAFASDASFYRLIPKAIVLAEGIAEIQALFRFSHERKIPITFRTAGTSLSGQAVSDGILVEVARHWKGLTVEDNGRKVRVQPGVIGGYANSVLRPYGVKIGPDPASISTCMIGGILSNNSSGMCCGVSQNAYHTLDSLTFVLPSGTVINTADARSDEDFRAKEPRLVEGLLELKRQIESNPALYQRVRAKYRTKNTTGYSLNAFIDFERPIDIFEHVMIGSEGTLAFIAEAVLNTVPDLPVKYTGLLLFPTLHDAAAAIVPLRDAGAAALEIMDRPSLRSVEDQPGIPASIRKLPGEAAGLLVEFQAANEADRAELESVARYAIDGLKLLEAPLFTHQAAEQAALWKIRAGMFPSVGAVRKSGTTVIIEDVAFAIQHLADACVDLQKLFLKHGYDNGIIFGHAKDGNLHFVITPSLNDQKAVDQYARFLDDLIKLVVERYDGALKAEHGTGRNMAPFVEAEWGGDAYRIMKRLKELADPESLLNPGVIINSDPKGHLADLKRMPVVEDEVDKCIECGYCEPKCPSRNLTTTPRQRIVVRQRNAAPERRRWEWRSRRAGSRFPLHGARYLRGGWLVRYRLPGFDRYRAVNQALPPDPAFEVGTPARHELGESFRVARALDAARTSRRPRNAVCAGNGSDGGDYPRYPFSCRRIPAVERGRAPARRSSPRDRARERSGNLLPHLHFPSAGPPAGRNHRAVADGGACHSRPPRRRRGLHSSGCGGHLLWSSVLFQRF